MVFEKKRWLSLWFSCLYKRDTVRSDFCTSKQCWKLYLYDLFLLRILSRKRLEKNRPNMLDFYLQIPNFSKGIDRKPISLYPYQSKDLKVTFFYGNDFTRQKASTFVSHFESLLFNWFNLFLVMAAVLLCMLRRVVRLRRDGFMSSFIDVFATFIGGGNLVINPNRLEKWFFGILLATSIFVNAIGLHSDLYASFVESDQRVNTFKDLAKINPPIYLSREFDGNIDIINGMLRWHLTIHVNFIYFL